MLKPFSKWLMVLLFCGPLLAASAEPKLTDGLIVFLGNIGMGKSTLGSLLVADGVEKFISKPYPASCTAKCSVKKSFMNQWQVVDTPGLDDNKIPRQLIFEEILSAFSLSKGHYKLCFVVIPRGGRLIQEDMRTIDSILSAFKKNPSFYVIVNQSPMDSQFQKEFLEGLHKNLEYLSHMLPQGVLFLPNLTAMNGPEVDRLKDDLREFVKNMKGSELSEVTKVDISDAERTALIVSSNKIHKRLIKKHAEENHSLRSWSWGWVAVPVTVGVLGCVLYCMWQ